jgi:hypothetical protein
MRLPPISLRFCVSIVGALTVLRCQTKTMAPAGSGPALPSAVGTTGAAASPSTSSQSATAAPSVASAPSKAASEPPAWGAVPPASEFSYVLDGECILANVYDLEGTRMVQFGEHGQGYMARVLDTGVADKEPFTIGIDDAFKYDKLLGRYPDQLWNLVNAGGRAYQRGALAKYDGSWKWAVSKPDSAESVTSAGPKGLRVIGTAKAPPLYFAGDAQVSLVASGPTLFVRATTCVNEKCTTVVHVAREEQKILSKSFGADDGGDALTVRQADEAYFGSDELWRWDGTSWEKVPGAGKAVRFPQRAKDGSIWFTRKGDERVFRWKDGVAKEMGPKASFIDGAAQGTLFSVSPLGKKLMALDITRADESPVPWREVPIAPPVFANRPLHFAIQSIKSFGPSEVWLNVTYTENPKWGTPAELRRALLRNSAPKETVRCNFDKWNGKVTEPFRHWAPAATESCATPLVRFSSKISVDEKFATSRGVLKGKPGAEDITLVAIKDVGAFAQVSDMSKAEAVAKILAKAFPLDRVEIACAAKPPIVRSVRFDPKSGEITESKDYP